MTRFERLNRFRLLARRDALVESIAASAVRLRAAWATGAEWTADLRVQELTVQELRRVDRALLRLVQSAYGICESCGRTLGTQQLLGEPEAALCTDCAPQSARAVGEGPPV